MIQATILINGRKFTGEGESARAALESIPYKGFAKFKSVLVIGKKEVVLLPMQTQRLFSPNPTIREVALKQLVLRFE